MKTNRSCALTTVAVLLSLCAVNALAAEPTPRALASWQDGPAKQNVLRFVAEVTNEGGPNYVKPEARIATFDNDGTLWCEQPMYVQLVFAIDRVKALAPKHPEWKEKQPFKAVLDGDLMTALASGHKGLSELVMVTHAGTTTAEFERVVQNWLTTARHPRFKRPYTELVYQPMLEVIAYLRENGFKTYIVSGGGIEFMRPWTERVYGIPPEQVIGSSIKTKYEIRDGEPVLLRLAELNFVDDHGGKPVGIGQFIGRRPYAAFGNSTGDQQMLEWTQAGSGARLMMLVHHDDAIREFAYGAESKIGTFSDALMAEANRRGWTVISMKNDWKKVFPFEK